MEELLAKVIVGMTISLDGFVAGQNGNAGRLYPDLAALRDTAYMPRLHIPLAISISCWRLLR